MQALTLGADRKSADIRGTIPLSQSGWCVLRAWSDGEEYPVLDKYAYATTSPIYVTIGGTKPKSPEDAKYFAAWIDRTIEATSRYPDWNSQEEKAGVLAKLREARAVYERLE